jgi:hypothetical protein
MVTANANCQDMNHLLIQNIAKEYNAANSEKRKLGICIDAINSGVLCRGCKVNVIDLIFGTDYSSRLPQKGRSMAVGVVNFLERPIESMADSAVSAPIRGWYFAFEYDHAGTIQNYYLTNLHK